ncbi:MAG: hypothetical protein KGZ54_09305 [Dethiobacter sp.]|nr:hypothetical protein [Dethiobacter sp.]
MGFALGLLLAALLILLQGTRPVPAAEVERMAREQGMVYPHEVVPFTEGETVTE